MLRKKKSVVTECNSDQKIILVSLFFLSNCGDMDRWFHIF